MKGWKIHENIPTKKFQADQKILKVLIHGNLLGTEGYRTDNLE